MSSPTSTIARWLAGRAPIAAATVLFASGLVLAPSASAGTYSMYKCAPGVPAVSPGWSVFGNTTNANTVLSNTCSAGGSIGDYVFTDGQAGAVTENGESGSQVGLRSTCRAARPASRSTRSKRKSSPRPSRATTPSSSSPPQGSPFRRRRSCPTAGAAPATETWTLPQGARDFEAYVNCSTDRSSPTCDFADSTVVPALSNITLSLEDDTSPTVET